MEDLNLKNKYSLEELIKVRGNTTFLKDIVRGVYLYNSNILKQRTESRIQLFSEAMLKRVTSAIKIQKLWRGYIFRKKHHQYLKTLVKMQRAATIIQRWIRRLPLARKKEFLFRTVKRLAAIHDQYFYIDLDDYFELIRRESSQN